MNDIQDKLNDWRKRGERIALATVVSTWGSSPRPVGSKMAVTLSGGIVGSVSAGCVEGAVVEECQKALKSGKSRLLQYGVVDEDAWDVGLACGGTIRIWVEPFVAYEGIYDELEGHLASRNSMVVVSELRDGPVRENHKLLVLEDGSIKGDLSLPGLYDILVETALGYLHSGKGGDWEAKDGATLFFDVYGPVPRLIVIGAVHVAQYLVSFASQIGFDTIVIDPREAFATRDRFPQATQILCQWPHRVLPEIGLDNATSVAALTHDPKIDDPALKLVLGSNVRYVGALGSQNTNQQRLKRLAELGATQAQLARLHAPIGLPLGGRSPQEIALSIMAEIIQARYASSP